MSFISILEYYGEINSSIIVKSQSHPQSTFFLLFCVSFDARYTIGGTVGPTLGGRLGTLIAARVAVVGCLLAAGLVLSLPSKVDDSSGNNEDGDDDSKRKKGEDAKSNENSSSSSKGDTNAPWSERARAVVGLTWPLLAVKLMAAVVNSSVGSVRPLVLKNDFGVTEAELG